MEGDALVEARRVRPFSIDLLTSPILRRDVGRFGVWSVSSAKFGNAASALRDMNTSTYWQSDGTQPHLIEVRFGRLQMVSAVAVYLDFSLDESYTPRRIAVHAGSSPSDASHLLTAEFSEPRGWIILPVGGDIPLDAPPNAPPYATRNGLAAALSSADGYVGAPIGCFYLAIAILENHQNGRDCHVRQVALLGPSEGGPPRSARPALHSPTTAGGQGGVVGTLGDEADTAAGPGVSSEGGAGTGSAAQGVAGEGDVDDSEGGLGGGGVWGAGHRLMFR